jgi:hypothetical protein
VIEMNSPRLLRPEYGPYGYFLQHDKGIAFQREGRLIQDAFLVSSLIEVLSRVFKERTPPGELERVRLSAGANLLQKLKRAERYVSQDSVNLVPQPEGVGVIVSILENGWEHVDSSIDNASSVIGETLDSQQLATSPTDKSFKDAIEFLRTVHRGITKQLTDLPDDLSAT